MSIHLDILMASIPTQEQIDALLKASKEGNLECVQSLIEQYCFTHHCINLALIETTIGGHAEIFYYLMGRGADIYYYCAKGYHNAVTYEHNDIIYTYLLDDSGIQNRYENMYKDIKW